MMKRTVKPEARSAGEGRLLIGLINRLEFLTSFFISGYRRNAGWGKRILISEKQVPPFFLKKLLSVILSCIKSMIFNFGYAVASEHGRRASKTHNDIAVAASGTNTTLLSLVEQIQGNWKRDRKVLFNFSCYRASSTEYRKLAFLSQKGHRFRAQRKTASEHKH